MLADSGRSTGSAVQTHQGIGLPPLGRMASPCKLAARPHSMRVILENTCAASARLAHHRVREMPQCIHRRT